VDDDRPVGRAADVDRLLQLLALLRAHEVGVSRTTVEQLDRYRDLSQDAADKAVARDLKHLRDLGFRIDSVSGPGQVSRWVLRTTPWRAPIALEEFDGALLAWVFRTAQADEADLRLTTFSSYDSLTGSIPTAIGTLQAALAGQRSVVVDADGEDRVLEPAQLVVQSGRWTLLARYPGHDRVYGHRVDRLADVRLGEPLAAPPAPVESLDALDPTAWEEDEPVQVELRCAAEDLGMVVSWFPRAEVAEDGAEAVLRFEVRHRAALLDRVLGLAGAVRIVSPAEVVHALRDRLLPFVEEPA
jgi:predicted DNA-binding transcriptional regulator YafY